MSLDIIIGCMFSSKSTELIKLMRRQISINKKILAITYITDIRYSENKVTSHDSITQISTEHVKNLMTLENRINDYDCIFIEEGQFFDDLKAFVLKAVEEYNKYVCVSGLNGDYLRNQFQNMMELIPLSDNVTKLNALCQICADGTPGIFTKRIGSDTERILIGGKDTYIPVCRSHYHN